MTRLPCTNGGCLVIRKNSIDTEKPFYVVQYRPVLNIERGPSDVTFSDTKDELNTLILEFLDTYHLTLTPEAAQKLSQI